jgi:hypothetical protein
MPRFLVDASYCTRGGNMARWSTTVDAGHTAEALGKAHRAVLARHSGASKIDISVVADIGTPGTRNTADPGKAGGEAIELRIALRILDEGRLRQIATIRMAASGFDTDPATHFHEPLGDLLFEALVGSNSDPVSPLDMGIEIVGWTGHPIS